MVEDLLKKLLIENKDVLISQGLEDFLNKSIKKKFDLPDLFSLSTELYSKGLFSLNSKLLKTVLSQDNFNYFVFSKQNPLPQDDIYKIDLNKPIQSRLPKNYSFFGKMIFEKYYPSLLEKLNQSLSKEGKYIEANSIASVFKQEFGKVIGDESELEKILESERNFNKLNLYDSGAPESSYILSFDQNLSKLKRTIASLKNFDNKKELILLAHNEEEVEKLKQEDFIMQNLLSIEKELGVNGVYNKNNPNLNIRIVNLSEDVDKYMSYNIGAIKALTSNSKYVSFLNNGDVLDSKGFSSLKSKLKNNKNFAIGGISYFNKSGKKVDDVNLRWRNYLLKDHKGDYLNEFENYSLFDFSNHLISAKNLEELLLRDKFIFDPRLNKHSSENDFFRRFVSKYSPESVVYEDSISVNKEKGVDFDTRNGKKNIIFITSTLENTHGVPVVMNNLSNNLDKNKYNVFYFVNDFDSKKIKFYDSSKEDFIEASNRQELFEILKSHNPSFLEDIDIIHSHTWHLADDFKHFHTKNIYTGEHEEDNLKFKDFLGNFSKAKFIFTDHSNPTEDLANINEAYFKNKGYENLSTEKKKQIIEKYKINSLNDSDWQDRWAFTSMSGKNQMSSLADLVINVSNSQHNEGKELIPDYNPKNQKTVYNGIDLIDLSKNPGAEREISNFTNKFREEYGFKKEDNIILYAGRLSRRKGVYDLAESLKKINKDVGETKLLIVGDANPDVKDKLKELSGMENIIYTGRIKDRKELAALYRVADLTVQPTHGECFNQVIGESLSQGTPVVATAVSGPKEVYIEKGWAYGVERTTDHNKNIDNLSYAIKDSLSRKYQIKDYVRQKVIPEITENLSLEKMVKEHDKIYSELSGSK